MEFISQNWQAILTVIIILAVVIGGAIGFFKASKPEKIKKIKVWLLQAIVQVEAAIGDKMGRVKLAMVYDMFISKFPVMSKLISFDEFSSMVDEMLKEAKILIEEKLTYEEQKAMIEQQ